MNPKQKVRMTRQRRVILETLSKDKTHPSVEEVYSKVRKIMPRVSLGTVYRNLEKLSAEGLILQIDTAGNRMRFDGNANDHHHIRCTMCNRIDDVHDIGGLPGLKFPQEIAGYRLLGVRVYLTGLCRACREVSEATGSTGGD